MNLEILLRLRPKPKSRRWKKSASFKILLVPWNKPSKLGLKSQQENNERKRSTIDQLNMQKKIYYERMDLKEKEINSILDRERALTD